MDGPYVLIPYSIGGIYATYWECIYLDEVEALGNCQYVGIPGDHLIYQQKPDDVAEAVEQFLEALE